MGNILLSVIMPCYNVADTIHRAINSVLMQRVDFDYEILIIDDCSSDSSPEIFAEYERKYDFVHVIRNDINSGNAESFYQGLSKAKGEYFCVLDGDDFYTIQDKLQRQIDFFRKDIQEEYVAVAHRFIYVNCSGVFIPEWPIITEFNYEDFLLKRTGAYYHTSTYMYRNIFKDSVPIFFREKELRGDTPRTLFHLKYSGKKVKILSFIGSAYFYSLNGIWSGIDKAKQAKHSYEMWKRIMEIEESTYLKKEIEKTVVEFREKIERSLNDYKTYDFHKYDYYIKKIQGIAKNYAFNSGKEIFEKVYFDEYIDTLLASLGYSFRAFNPQFIQSEVISDNILILCGKLNPKGGGIFKEIIEIISMYPLKKVHILLTDSFNLEENMIDNFSSVGCENICCIPENCQNIMEFISEKLISIAPEKLYYYAAHDNPFATVLINSGVCKNILLFSFDHGYICGIDNPNIDFYIAKRPVDFELLKKKFNNRVIQIPTWGSHVCKAKQEIYKPFKNHDKLITACAAARFYKVDGEGEDSYIQLIASLLKKTNGVHYHFGNIPSDKLIKIYEILSQNNVSKEHFINIEWADDLSDEMLSKEIDVFIEPFPTISYKISLEVMSVGIPIIGYYGFYRMKNLDFLYDDYLKWTMSSQFLDILSNITSNDLIEHSKKAVEYYCANHDISIIKPYFVNELEFHYPHTLSAPDGVLNDVNEYLSKHEYKALYLNPKNEKSVFFSSAEEIQRIKDSGLYKIGKIITFIPWVIKKLFNGEALKEGFHHPWDKISLNEVENKFLLSSLKGSITYRVGKFICSPVLLLKTNTNEKHVQINNIYCMLKQVNYYLKTIESDIIIANKQNEDLFKLLKESNEINMELIDELKKCWRE